MTVRKSTPRRRTSGRRTSDPTLRTSHEDRPSERPSARPKERMNERVKERVNERANERANERKESRRTPEPEPPVPMVRGPVDPLLFGLVVALVAFGVVMVYSASAVLAYERHDDGQHFLVRQAIYAVAGLALMAGFARMDYHRLRPWSHLALLGAIALLAATVLGYGSRAGGAMRWIAIGPVHIQPAEVAKLALIVWLAASLAKKAQRIRTFSIGFLPHVLGAGILMALCLKQPDFGSAVVMAVLTFSMLFVAGTRVYYMLCAAFLAAPAAIYLVAGSEYRMRRITAFLSPFEHRQTAGYQVAESLVSLGSGGMTGVGIGDSRQKLFFLPEAHTDFIGAIVGEELGFVGLAVLVVAYAVVVWRGMRAAHDAVDDFGTYLALGVTAFLGLQAFTNLGVVVGMLPPKGMVLPFLSYGGSAMLVNCAAAGILLDVSRVRMPMDALRLERPERTSRPEREPTPALAAEGATP